MCVKAPPEVAEAHPGRATPSVIRPISPDLCPPEAPSHPGWFPAQPSKAGRLRREQGHTRVLTLRSPGEAEARRGGFSEPQS